MRVHIGSDHAGYDLKSALVERLTAAGHDVVDLQGLDLPPTSFTTRALWYELHPSVLAEDFPMEVLLGTLHATEHAQIAVLPLIAMSLSAFATLTFLTKNSFLEEIRKQYVTTARAKGLTERQVVYGHVFRNAMLIIIAGFPGAFISAFISFFINFFIAAEKRVKRSQFPFFQMRRKDSRCRKECGSLWCSRTAAR